VRRKAKITSTESEQHESRFGNGKPVALERHTDHRKDANFTPVADAVS
jgi:hypothetical protein